MSPALGCFCDILWPTPWVTVVHSWPLTLAEAQHGWGLAALAACPPGADLRPPAARRHVCETAGAASGCLASKGFIFHR